MLFPDIGKKVYDIITCTNVEIVGISFENGTTISNNEQRSSYLCTAVWVKLNNGKIDGRYLWELGLEFNSDETDFVYLAYDEKFLEQLREIQKMKLSPEQLARLEELEKME